MGGEELAAARAVVVRGGVSEEVAVHAHARQELCSHEALSKRPDGLGDGAAGRTAGRDAGGLAHVAVGAEVHPRHADLRERPARLLGVPACKVGDSHRQRGVNTEEEFVHVNDGNPVGRGGHHLPHRLVGDQLVERLGPRLPFVRDDGGHRCKARARRGAAIGRVVVEQEEVGDALGEMMTEPLLEHATLVLEDGQDGEPVGRLDATWRRHAVSRRHFFGRCEACRRVHRPNNSQRPQTRTGPTPA
eukprot:6633235-Prymnesium_polylepis.1